MWSARKRCTGSGRRQRKSENEWPGDYAARIPRPHCFGEPKWPRDFLLVPGRRMWYNSIAIRGYDGIGRHARFRFSCFACGFESHYPYQVGASDIACSDLLYQSERARAAAPPFQIEPAALGFDLVFPFIGIYKSPSAPDKNIRPRCTRADIFCSYRAWRSCILGAFSAARAVSPRACGGAAAAPYRHSRSAP